MAIAYLFLLLHYLNNLSQIVALRLNIFKINKKAPSKYYLCGGKFYHDCTGFHFYRSQRYSVYACRHLQLKMSFRKKILMKYWQVYCKLFIELFITLFSSRPFRKCILENPGVATQCIKKMTPRIQLILGLMLCYHIL